MGLSRAEAGGDLVTNFAAYDLTGLLVSQELDPNAPNTRFVALARALCRLTGKGCISSAQEPLYRAALPPR